MPSFIPLKAPARGSWSSASIRIRKYFCLGEILAGVHVRVPDFAYGSRFETKAYRYLSSDAALSTRMMDRYFARSDRPVMVYTAM